MAAAVKRALDLTLGSIALVVLAPLMAATALTIRLTMGSPVLFRQPRAGYHGRAFTLIKFRTMQGPSVIGREAIDDAQRLTPAGRLVRKTSLDELPQLINVLCGEMSLVGPRPLLLEYLPLYSHTQARRHEVKPGMTGWTQVRGRNDLTWDQKFALDVWYVDHQSLWLDLRIIAETAWHVVDARGVSARGHATMARFEGNTPRQDSDPFDSAP